LSPTNHLCFGTELEKGEVAMNRIKTLVLAASVFTLTLGAFPHSASATDQTKATTSTPTGGTKGEGSDQDHKDWIELSSIIPATIVVLSSVLPF
jgi:hypothetical protein